MRDAVLVVGASLAIASAIAQNAVPVEHEPRHRPGFTYRYIRVLDVTLEPGYVTLFPTHAINNVAVPLAAGTLRVDGAAARLGTPQEIVVGRLGLVAAPPAHTHRVVNAGATPVHMLDVELLHPQAGSSADDEPSTPSRPSPRSERLSQRPSSHRAGH
jgi:hypothetical protein